MRYPHSVMACIIVCLGSAVPAMAANYTVTGTLEFERDYRAELRDFNGTGKIAFPKDTHIELVKKNWSGSWDVVINSMTTNANGSYSITYDTNTTAEFRLRVSIETIKDLPNDYERINVNGQFILPLVPWWNWWFETNTFTFAGADPANNTFTVNIYVGSTTDSDSAVVNHAMTMRDMHISKPISVAYTEEHMRLMAAVLYAADKAYLDVAQSGKIGWLGTTHGQDTDGQAVLCPGGTIGQLSGGAISWPDDFQIHFNDHLDCWTAPTVVHEFGHIVHYHTTSWSIWDLIGELGGHVYWKETDPKVAYCEGWAEFFEEVFVAKYSNIIDRDPSPFVTGNSWIWAGVQSYLSYPPTPSNSVFKGTDNSGEKVEGTVAQVFWRLKDDGQAFATKIEPVWAVIRDGATAGSYNSRKTFEDFYDQWMVSSTDQRRQVCRDLCDERGIVYSRAKLTQIASVASKDNFVAASDKLWVSAESKFKLEQMTKQQLNVETEVDEVATDCRFQVCQTGRKDKFVWANVTDAEMQGSTNWKAPFATDTSPDGFYGVLNAINHGLSNSYYLVRGAIDKDGTATTFVKDNLMGPLLDANDTSGQNTATWWNGLGIVYQIKVDKVKPVVEERRPAANP